MQPLHYKWYLAHYRICFLLISVPMKHVYFDLPSLAAAVGPTAVEQLHLLYHLRRWKPLATGPI